MIYQQIFLSELKKVKYLLFEFLKIIIQYIHSLFIFNNKDLGNISVIAGKNILKFNDQHDILFYCNQYYYL